MIFAISTGNGSRENIRVYVGDRLTGLRELTRTGLRGEKVAEDGFRRERDCNPNCKLSLLNCTTAGFSTARVCIWHQDHHVPFAGVVPVYSCTCFSFPASTACQDGVGKNVVADLCAPPSFANLKDGK